MEENKNNFDLSDAEKNREISTVSIKLKRNIKKIQENINWKKKPDYINRMLEL